MRTLLSRNAIVTVLYNIAYQYSTSTKNSFRSLVVTESCGLPLSYITILTSLVSFMAFVVNVPIGSLIDRRRGMMRRVMISVNLLRGLLYLFGYGTVSSTPGVFLVYALDGVLFCFCSTMGPALMAISVDKKAMGSAFALYTGVTTICTSTAKSLGIALFTSYGQQTAGMVSGGIALLSGVILIALDGDRVSDTLRREKAQLKESGRDDLTLNRDSRYKSRFLRELLSGVSLAAVPLALCIGLGQIEETVCNSYLAIIGEERSFDYYVFLSVLYGISGVLTVFIGVICDVINPIILVYLGLAGKVIGNLMISITMDQSVFLIGLAAITLTDFFMTVVQISAIKLFPYRKQGSLAATINLMMHISMMILTLPAGFLADRFGVGGAYMYSAFTSFLGAVAYTYAIIQFHRHRGMDIIQ